MKQKAERADLCMQIAEKEQKLQELLASPTALPDLTGCEVTHKMFGVGKVLPSTDQFLVIDFNGQQKKFSTTTSMTSGYLTASDPAVMEQMQDYQAYTKEKDQLEKELKTMKSNLLNMAKLCFSYLPFSPSHFPEYTAPGSELTLCRGYFLPFCATKI